MKSSASFQWMKAPNSRLCEFTGVTLVSKSTWWQGLNGCLFITFQVHIEFLQFNTCSSTLFLFFIVWDFKDHQNFFYSENNIRYSVCHLEPESPLWFGMCIAIIMNRKSCVFLCQLNLKDCKIFITIPHKHNFNIYIKFNRRVNVSLSLDI